MSIQGKCFSRLYIGKTKIQILSLAGNLTKVKYKNIESIEYQYAERRRFGELRFNSNSESTCIFYFKDNVNEKIERAIARIREHSPNLPIQELDLDNDTYYSNKSHFFTGLLCFLLGRVGAHRFYVGKYFSGSIYLLLFILSNDFLTTGFVMHWYISLFLWLFVMVDLMMLCFNLFTDKDHKPLHPDHSKMPPKSASIAFFIASIFYLVHGGLINYVISAICVAFAIYYFYKAIHG